MSYEESNLLSLLKKQDIDSLFLEATNYLCQTKSLFEEKEQLQQENEQLKEVVDKAIEYVEWNKDKAKFDNNTKEYDNYTFLNEENIDELLDILERGS